MSARKLVLALLLVSSAFAHAAAIDSQKSSITATFKQLGVEVVAKFNRVSGVIDYDAMNPASGKANIVIPLASFDLGDPEYNQEVQKKDWFDSARFPQATFISSEIKPAGAGKILVEGELTIKGKALAVSIPVTVRQEGREQIFEGKLPIKRLYFNIGEGDWKDTDTLADEVLISFKAVTSN